MLSNAATETAPLSRGETAVLSWADRTRRARLTTRDVAGVVGEAAAARTAASLVRKGALDRVGHGVYVVRPLRALAAPWSISALAAVAHLLTGQTYYVGGPAALALHRLTTQAYGSVVDVFVTGHRRPRTLGGARIVFHTAPPEAFNFGLTSVEVEGVGLTVSDPERTILDLVERPDLLGRAATFAAVTEAASRLALDRLVGYALRWPNLSTCQRLGVLLERAGIPSASGIGGGTAGQRERHDPIGRLAERVAEAELRGVPAMVRSRPRHGRVHVTWRIVLNDQDEASDSPAA